MHILRLEIIGTNQEFQFPNQNFKVFYLALYLLMVALYLHWSKEVMEYKDDKFMICFAQFSIIKTE